MRWIYFYYKCILPFTLQSVILETKLEKTICHVINSKHQTQIEQLAYQESLAISIVITVYVSHVILLPVKERNNIINITSRPFVFSIVWGMYIENYTFKSLSRFSFGVSSVPSRINFITPPSRYVHNSFGTMNHNAHMFKYIGIHW